MIEDIAEDPVAAELAALRDLFQRRLMEDRDKRQLYEQLSEQIALAQSALERQITAPIARELVLMLDSIEHAERSGADPGQLLRSVQDEVRAILARRFIEQFDALGQPFDPSCHEAVGQVEAGPATAGTVVEEIRAGWRFGLELLRPARVVVAVAPRPAAEAEPAGID